MPHDAELCRTDSRKTHASVGLDLPTRIFTGVARHASAAHHEIALGRHPVIVSTLRQGRQEDRTCSKATSGAVCAHATPIPRAGRAAVDRRATWQRRNGMDGLAGPLAARPCRNGASSSGWHVGWMFRRASGGWLPAGLLRFFFLRLWLHGHTGCRTAAHAGGARLGDDGKPSGGIRPDTPAHISRRAISTSRLIRSRR